MPNKKYALLGLITVCITALCALWMVRSGSVTSLQLFVTEPEYLSQFTILYLYLL